MEQYATVVYTTSAGDLKVTSITLPVFWNRAGNGDGNWHSGCYGDCRRGNASLGSLLDMLDPKCVAVCLLCSWRRGIDCHNHGGVEVVCFEPLTVFFISRRKIETFQGRYGDSNERDSLLVGGQHGTYPQALYYRWMNILIESGMIENYKDYVSSQGTYVGDNNYNLLFIVSTLRFRRGASANLLTLQHPGERAKL